MKYIGKYFSAERLLSYYYTFHKHTIKKPIKSTKKQKK